MVHAPPGNDPQKTRPLTHAYTLMHPCHGQTQNKAGLWLTFSA